MRYIISGINHEGIEGPGRWSAGPIDCETKRGLWSKAYALMCEGLVSWVAEWEKSLQAASIAPPVADDW